MSKYVMATKIALSKRIKKLVRERDEWEHEALKRGKEVVKMRRLLLNYEHMLDKDFFNEMREVFEPFWNRNKKGQ